jgi:hypothetical protein
MSKLDHVSEFLQTDGGGDMKAMHIIFLTGGSSASSVRHCQSR